MRYALAPQWHKPFVGQSTEAMQPVRNSLIDDWLSHSPVWGSLLPTRPARRAGRVQGCHGLSGATARIITVPATCVDHQRHFRAGHSRLHAAGPENVSRLSAQDALLVTFGKTKVTPAPGLRITHISVDETGNFVSNSRGPFWTAD